MPDASLAKIRRGLGVIYLLAAFIHAGEMTLAALYSMGRLPLIIGAGLWSELYYAHFLFLILGGLGYLALSFKRSGIFYYETLVDFLIGIAVFVVLLTLAGVVLVRGAVGPWWSLLPSAFLGAYGVGLLNNRRFGFGARQP